LKFIISGINGQDGHFLTAHLCKLGHVVVGLTRDLKNAGSFSESFTRKQVKVLHCSYDEISIFKILKSEKPHVVINLAGQAYVAKSWLMQDETLRSIAQIPQYFLEAILAANPKIRFLQASSSQIYAPSRQTLRETSSIGPTSPYGCAKTYAHFLVRNYRETHGLFAVNAVLFNHESPRRNSDFFCQKIVQGAIKIKKGELKNLALGNLELIRDIGCADEFMIALSCMATMDRADDYNICTGRGAKLKDLVSFVFSQLGLSTKGRIHLDDAQIRRAEPPRIVGDPGKIARDLGWKPKRTIEAVLAEMICHAKKND
jgi:GDPmannose 4,6-dehydratase